LGTEASVPTRLEDDNVSHVVTIQHMTKREGATNAAKRTE